MKVSEFRKLIREEVRKVLKEETEMIKPTKIHGWVHAWNPMRKKYKMFPSATAAIQKGFTTLIAANDVEVMDAEGLEDMTPEEFSEDGWYDFKNNIMPTYYEG
jgi:hypothetical protein